MAKVETDSAVDDLRGSEVENDISHPLQNAWVLWFDQGSKAKKPKKQDQQDYEANLKPVGNPITTVWIFLCQALS